MSRRTPIHGLEDTDDPEEDWEDESGQSGSFSLPYLIGIGGVIAFMLVAAMFVAAGPSLQSLLPSSGPPAALAEQPGLPSPASVNRSSCPDIGSSDLRSPGEGLWFEDNCGSAAGVQSPAPDSCNRGALDPARFTEIASGLYVFRQSWASSGYLWYAGADGCMSLVSSRIVTVVCVDLTVSFEWDAGACSTHGGVLTWVNGP